MARRRKPRKIIASAPSSRPKRSQTFGRLPSNALRSFFTTGAINRVFELAEAEAHFTVDAVSPEAAARTIGVPVLLIHGSIDHETPPQHSRRVFEALRGPRGLILVPGAVHHQSLQGEVWQDIDRWIDGALASATVDR